MLLSVEPSDQRGQRQRLSLLLRRQVDRLPGQKSDSARESRLDGACWAVGFTGGRFRARPSWVGWAAVGWVGVGGERGLGPLQPR